MENNNIKPEDVIFTAISILGDIQVPVRYKSGIADPIEKVVMSLYAVTRMLTNNQAPKEEKSEEVTDNAGDNDVGESLDT